MSYMNVSFNGNTYQIPTTGEIGPWAVALNQFLVGLASGAPGLNVANTFVDPVAFSQNAAPAQGASAAKVYTGTDGFLYTLPAEPNTNVPIKVGSGSGSSPTFAAKTADYPITADDAQTRFSNLGALGAVALTLPTATAGLEFYFACAAAQNLTVTGGTFVGPGSMSGTSVIVYGTVAANRYTSFKLGCYDGSTWLLQELTGAVVVS